MLWAMRSCTALVLVALASCGRLGFEPVTGDGAVDDVVDDGAAADATDDRICVGLSATCGAAGSSSCCATDDLPGGTFFRSHDMSSDGMFPARTAPATVGELRIDTYEVTVGRFRRFVAAGQGTQASPPAAGTGAHQNLANSGWSSSWNTSLVPTTVALKTALKCDPTYQTWSDAPAAFESHPINCITWYEAMAFCVWDGGYLATEAEWNYAAAGGDEQRAYPWSSPPTSTSIDATRASYACLGDGMPACSRDDLLRVGSVPAGDGRWGHADLSGNLWEWVLDWYAEPYGTPCVDCANLTDAAFRVHRGGAFRNLDTAARSATRGYDPANYRASDVGVRCARPRA